MFNEDIKVYVPTPEISALVQEKLFEIGYSWMGDKHVYAKNMPHLYALKNGRILCGETPSFFDDDESDQVHYLQILTGDLDGVLFRNTDEGIVYYDSGDVIYWVEDDVINYLVGYTAECYLKYNNHVKVDVNEEEIMTNEMPKLEAGKHVIKSNHGEYFLILDSKYDGLSGLSLDSGWVSDLTKQSEHFSIAEVHRISNTLHAMSDTEYNERSLIWKRDDKAAKRQKEYDELQRQIAQLQKQADKLQEMDDE